MLFNHQRIIKEPSIDGPRILYILVTGNAALNRERSAPEDECEIVMAKTRKTVHKYTGCVPCADG